MKNFIHEVRTRTLARRATLGLALSASAMSLLAAWLVPFGRVWPSLAWAVVGCVAGLWTIQIITSPAQAIGDVIAGVDAESPTPALAAPPRLVRKGARS